VVGIHHEVPVITLTGLKHRINRDWDLVRLSLVKATHAHCSTAQWKYHPEADGIFGCGGVGKCYDNEGYTARLTLQHASGGC
jgi:hypothetical protein